MDSATTHDLGLNTDYENSNDLRGTDYRDAYYTRQPDHWGLQDTEELDNWTSAPVMKPEPANLCRTSRRQRNSYQRCT